MLDKLTKLISTFFYVGDFPVAPGTMASFVGALLAIILAPNSAIYIIVTAIVCALGFLVSGKMERILGKKDPGCVVIDEVAGILIALFLLPLKVNVLVTAFFLFRAFDMFKIYPCNIIEEKGGSYGIMMDDIVAGVYTNLVMHGAIRIMEML